MWALQMAASRARSCVDFRIDCRSIIEMYKMGCSANTGAASRYARVWKQVHSAFEGLGNAIDLRWMPAHTTEAGMRTLSGGVTRTARWANDQAQFAKEAPDAVGVPAIW